MLELDISLYRFILPVSPVARIMACLVGSFIIVSAFDMPSSFNLSRSVMPCVLRISRSLTYISAVQAASSTALWWCKREQLRAFATVSSLKLLRCGSSILDRLTVSIYVKSLGISIRSQFLIIKLMSKSAL